MSAEGVKALQLAWVLPTHHALCKLAQSAREPELVLTGGAEGLPVPRLSCDVMSESLAKSDFQPRGAGGTAATVFAGGILGLEGVSSVAGGEHLYLPAADVDDQNCPAIGLPR